MAENGKYSYGLPVNLMNLINWNWDILELTEVILLNSFAVKAASFGNGFFYSISLAKNEFGINRRIYTKVIKKLEENSIIFIETCKAKRQKITVNFLLLSDKQFIDTLIKSEMIGNKDRSEYINEVATSFERHQKESEAKLQSIELKKSSFKDAENMINTLTEYYNDRRDLHSKETSGKIKYTKTKLTPKQEVFPKIKEALNVFNPDIIINSAIAYFDDVIKGRLKIKSITAYFFSKDAKGQFSVILEYLEKFNIEYAIRK